MILVTGATGTVGSHVVRRLDALGEKVRAFVHDTNKSVSIKGPNVEIFAGDYSDYESVQAAMRGADRLFMLVPSGPKQPGWEKSIIKAAGMFGVTRIVKLSVYGASPFSPISIEHIHWWMEKRVEESGIPYTFIRPNFFMQNTLGSAASIRAHGKFYGTLNGGKMPVIDARDIAECAVVALTQDGHEGRVYELTGPEAISYQEQASSIGIAIGKVVNYIDVSPDRFREQMLDAGMPSWLIDDTITYMQYFAMDQGTEVTPWVRQLTGREPISFDQFARDYADAFGAVAMEEAA